MSNEPGLWEMIRVLTSTSVLLVCTSWTKLAASAFGGETAEMPELFGVVMISRGMRLLTVPQARTLSPNQEFQALTIPADLPCPRRSTGPTEFSADRCLSTI